MIKGLFITGTDTDIGKTYVTSRIIKELKKKYRVGYYKAALSGAKIVDDKMIPDDKENVSEFANLQKEDCKVSYIYEDAYAPHLAAKKTDNPVELTVVEKDLNYLQKNHDIVVIEGSGGIICPLRDDDKQVMLTDVMKLAGYPLIIVTSSGLGSINSAVLTVLYAKSLGLEILGFIMNYFEEDNLLHQDNRKMIEKLSGYRVLGYLSKNGKKIKKFNKSDEIYK